jgi:hypothetical protein
VLALIVFGNSLLDAYLTLLHLEDGGSEANPLMHLTLAHSLTAFIVLKLSLIGVAVVADSLSALPLGHSRPAWCALSYGTVLVLHLIFSLHFIWKEHRCSTIRAPI